MPYVTEIMIIILSYLLGAIPFALIIGKLGYRVDVREHGSGNLGTTNTFRVLGKKAGILVLLGDMGKGLAAALLPSTIRKRDEPASCWDPGSDWTLLSCLCEIQRWQIGCDERWCFVGSFPMVLLCRRRYIYRDAPYLAHGIPLLDGCRRGGTSDGNNL